MNEIEQMIAALAASDINKADFFRKTPLPAAAATAALLKFLLKAETIQAYAEYASPDWKHLLIMPGDIIVVYTYVNEVTATGFNTQTNLGGRFPIDFSKKVEPQSFYKPEILIC